MNTCIKIVFSRFRMKSSRAQKEAHSEIREVNFAPDLLDESQTRVKFIHTQCRQQRKKNIKMSKLVKSRVKMRHSSCWGDAQAAPRIWFFPDTLRSQANDASLVCLWRNDTAWLKLEGHALDENTCVPWVWETRCVDFFRSHPLKCFTFQTFSY